MSENDFYVAIQGIMTEALEKGFKPLRIYEMLDNAAEEWMELNDPMEDYGDE
jgi:hypothetical protein